MKLIKNIVLLFITTIFVLSCSQQKARRPISESSGTFMRESAERNKKLIASEETKIDSINNQEILMSTKIIENNWNIGSLMTYYKNIDFTFRNKKPEDYNIKFLDDVMYPEYRNKIWNEYELVFIKGNRNINVV